MDVQYTVRTSTRESLSLPLSIPLPFTIHSWHWVLPDEHYDKNIWYKKTSTVMAQVQRSSPNLIYSEAIIFWQKPANKFFNLNIKNKNHNQLSWQWLWHANNQFTVVFSIHTAYDSSRFEITTMWIFLCFDLKFSRKYNLSSPSFHSFCFINLNLVPSFLLWNCISTFFFIINVIA